MLGFHCFSSSEHAGYRFGFNGHEKDDEVKTNGNSYTTLFRQFDPRLGRWWSRDPITHHWESPYVSMGNNPIAFNDPLGDKIKGSRKDKRAFRKRMKAEGRWKEIRKEYRGKGKDLMVQEVPSDRSSASLATAEISEESWNGGNTQKNVDWFLWSEPDPGTGTGLAGQNTNNQPLTPMAISPAQLVRNQINIPAPPQAIPPVFVNVPMIQRPPVNLNVAAPFVPGQTNFRNPTQGQNQLQNVANTFLNNPNATQITITINTSTVNLDQPARNPNQTVRQLLWARGRAMRNALLNMGVPASAFPQNWLQFNPGATDQNGQPIIGTNISVR